jgi:hypothetical protein
MEAIGVDKDADMLAWARREHAAWMKQDVTELMAQVLSLLDARRSLSDPDEGAEGTLRLVQHDLAEAEAPATCRGVDVVAAVHYTAMGLRNRAKLLAYFRQAYASLDKTGLFVMDFYGGPGAAGESENELGPAFFLREDTGRLTRFETIWEQEEPEAHSREAQCWIHFRFGDGSEIEQAYGCNLVLWEIEELREALAEAGFEKTRVFMETVDDEGEFTGDHEERAYPVYSDKGPTWFQAMLVARKG